MARRMAWSCNEISPARMVLADWTVIEPTSAPISDNCHTAKPASPTPNNTRAPNPPYRRPRIFRLSSDMQKIPWLDGKRKDRSGFGSRRWAYLLGQRSVAVGLGGSAAYRLRQASCDQRVNSGPF